MFVGSVAVLSLIHTAEAIVNCGLAFTPPNTELGACVHTSTACIGCGACTGMCAPGAGCGGGGCM
jgi:hypothetical protein